MTTNRLLDLVDGAREQEKSDFGATWDYRGAEPEIEGSIVRLSEQEKTDSRGETIHFRIIEVERDDGEKRTVWGDKAKLRRQLEGKHLYIGQRIALAYRGDIVGKSGNATADITVVLGDDELGS